VALLLVLRPVTLPAAKLDPTGKEITLELEQGMERVWHWDVAENAASFILVALDDSERRDIRF
jgi:hypothetical protein